MTLIGWLVDWTKLRMESLSLLHPQKPPKQKSKGKSQNKTTKTQEQNTQELQDDLKSYNRSIMGIMRESKKRTEAVFEAMTENFTHVNLRQQTKSPGISENTKQDKV